MKLSSCLLAASALALPSFHQDSNEYDLASYDQSENVASFQNPYENFEQDFEDDLYEDEARMPSYEANQRAAPRNSRQNSVSDEAEFQNALKNIDTWRPGQPLSFNKERLIGDLSDEEAVILLKNVKASMKKTGGRWVFKNPFSLKRSDSF